VHKSAKVLKDWEIYETAALAKALELLNSDTIYAPASGAWVR
jgi:hypothetical protein